MIVNYSKTYFTTLAIDKFIPIFKDFPELNFIILDSLNYLKKKNKVDIYAFVIMRDHFHVVWEVKKEGEIEDVITSFKRHTAKAISKYLRSVNLDYHSEFSSLRSDRLYKIWKLSKGNIRIQGGNILISKINYIHYNPTKGDYKSVELPEEYYFSSALAYEYGWSNFTFLTIASL